MRFEVMFGDSTDYIQAGNMYQACMLALDNCINVKKTFPISPFLVSNLDNGDSETVDLSVILGLRNVAADCEL